MEKDNVFFGGKGLTSAAANHIANIAKERYEAQTQALGAMGFCNETVSLIGSNDATTVGRGWNDSQVRDIERMCGDIAECKALIAWLREALKAKENLENEVKGLTDDAYCALTGKVKPSMTVSRPDYPKQHSVDDALGTLTMEQRAKYLTLEAFCATYGAAVHPDGCLSKARKDMLRKLNAEHRIDGEGRDTIVHTYTASVSDPAIVEDAFFAMQEGFRGKQSELNSIKFSLDNWVKEQDDAARAEYNKASAEWNAAYAAYSLEVKALNDEMEDYKRGRLKEIRDMKIVVPDNLWALANHLLGERKK